MISDIQESVKYTYGYRRIRIALNTRFGIKMNHKAILRIMNKYSINARIRRNKRYKRTLERIHTYENKLKREFYADEPDLKWVTDITQVQGKDGIVYLSAIKDLFKGSIIGYAINKHSRTSMVLETVQMAIKNKVRISDRKIILHSDRGTQYTSVKYNKLLSESNIDASMSKPGTPIDNAPIESFFSTLKVEWLSHASKMTVSEISNEIVSFINFYNFERIRLDGEKPPMHQR
ncbi:IS3 family transposase, partial [Fusibacter sp. A1]